MNIIYYLLFNFCCIRLRDLVLSDIGSPRDALSIACKVPPHVDVVLLNITWSYYYTDPNDKTDQAIYNI